MRIFISAISLAPFAKLKSDPDVFADALVPLEALQLAVRAAIPSLPIPANTSLIIAALARSLDGRDFNNRGTCTTAGSASRIIPERTQRQNSALKDDAWSPGCSGVIFRLACLPQWLSFREIAG